MRKQLKRMLSRYFPRLLSAVQRVRRRRTVRREQQIAAQIAPLRQEFGDRWGWTVQSGVLRGLKYHPGSKSDSLLARLVGCYEAEIHPSLEAALARNPAVMVDIGCEEGYFAVGLAVRQPAATMYAFDIEPWAQAACRDLARRNGVEGRVVVGGECTPEGLQTLLASHPPALVLCDCEGYELEIMNPERVPALRTADVVIELHDFLRPDVDITGTVVARFAATHDVRLIDRGDRNAADYPCLSDLPTEQRALAMYEPRMPVQQWAYLKSKRRE